MGDSLGRFTLRLAKRDFKFSVAHFTVFGPDAAEPLHGHNYRVKVDVEGRHLDAAGLVANVGPIKEKVRSLCRQLDERVLLPERSPWVRVIPEGDQLQVAFRERKYRFPKAEVVLLPLGNISMELLARYLWERLSHELEGSPAEALAVELEETDGQSCRYRAALGVERFAQVPQNE
jgi:6-pyruvoyltetrahydropterin/6-carboxytetrahydropterin synthase